METTPTHVFKRLAVDAFFNVIVGNRILVEWALDKSFAEPGPYVFTLYRGYAANDDHWIAVSTTTDQPWLYDKSPLYPQKGLEIFYKVVLVDGNGKTYESQAVGVGTYWTRYDWTLAKEIVRKEHMLLHKRTGVKGWLFKRRLWGDRCTLCVDPITNQISNPNCPVCYATGIVGGYYEPYEYWISMNPGQRLKKIDPEQGLRTETIETVRALAYPRPAQADVWVHAHTDQRFLIMPDIVAIARHRGIDLVLNLRLQERPKSEPMYMLSVPC